VPLPVREIASCSHMSATSMTLKENFEALMKNYEALRLQNEEIKGQNEYLKRQLGESLKQKRKEIRSSRSSNSSDSEQEMRVAPRLSSSSEAEAYERLRRGRKTTSHHGDIKVEIPEFEGKLDHDEFLEWL